mgnify:CR=1 FL=1
MKTNETNYLDAKQFAAILSATLAMAAEADIQVGARNVPANERRPAGLMLYISGVEVADDGQLIALGNIEEVESEAKT